MQRAADSQEQDSFWSFSVAQLFERLSTQGAGLTGTEAQKRLVLFGPNRLKPKKKITAFTLFLSQFKSPIILILLFAVFLSFFLGDATDALIILIIVLVSAVLGFKQEKGAFDTVNKLLATVQVKTAVRRDGKTIEIPLEEVVPGDVVVLDAGQIIPGDSRILESQNFFVDEAALTGETYPVEKTAGTLEEKTPLSQRTNVLFMGTHVVSGAATALVVRTAKESEFGKISERLKFKPPETEFEHGVRRFSYFLMEVTLVLVVLILAINIYFAKPILDSFLFALALAIGLTPQLLPAIISINLAHGAKIMAEQKVILKRLSSIENFGSMNVLCADKTGTLTEGAVQIQSALDVEGQESSKVLFYAFLNASYATGFANPIDEGLRNNLSLDLSGYEKLDEVPYDFLRKRLSILVSKGGKNFLVTKGALPNVLSACSLAEQSGGRIVSLEEMRESVLGRFEEASSRGFRSLGLAYRDLGSQTRVTKEDETAMTFLGLLVLIDPVKKGAAQVLEKLRGLGINLKIITGDNRLISAEVSQQVGQAKPRILAGPDIRQMSDEALVRQVNDVDVFAEVEPNQKERIILALRKAGNVVGYLGDGINDATALHSADVGISVDNAVDVAKEAADIILLQKELEVLIQGVQSGRQTFANTMKYIFMATSANFGNMFSMAGASLFLPFLPLLPKQILLTNLMTDFPEMTIARDCVDGEMVERPGRWNLSFIRNFMLTFGPISSLFDFLTFGVLLFLLHATPEQFRTGWFMESVISAAVIVLVVRTRRPFFKSRIGRPLLVTTMAICLATLVLPFLPFSRLFGFRPLPFSFFYVLVVVLILYISAVEVAKAIFYKKDKS